MASPSQPQGLHLAAVHADAADLAGVGVWAATKGVETSVPGFG